MVGKNKTDLFLSILAMDAYNRGYSQGIGNLSASSSTKVGNASFFRQSEVEEDKSQVTYSFYAISYTLGDEKIISYRGTDAVRDAATGYGVGAGFPGAPQGHMAAGFYNQVTGGNLYDANVTLTGHSLGGGLAGLVGAVYGQEAVLFDSMAFELAAIKAISAALPGEFYDPFIALTYFNNGEIRPNDKSGISGYNVKGELLSAPFISVGGTELNEQELGTELELLELDFVQRHSMSLLVLMLFAKDNANQDWSMAAEWLLPTLFDDTIGAAAGADPSGISGRDTESAKMRGMLAYSAIDEGTRVFGDTGIRALFDDAAELGRAIEAAGLATDDMFSKEDLQALSAIIAQFAGQLAVEKVLQDQDPTAVKGVAREGGGGLMLEAA